MYNNTKTRFYIFRMTLCKRKGLMNICKRKAKFSNRHTNDDFRLFIIVLKLNAAALSITLVLSPNIPL